MITKQPLTPPPAPTPLCATYAQLLPLLRAHELDPDQAEALQEHLADCAWCQSVLATYGVVDAALRRHFGPSHMAPSAVTMEEVLHATDQEDGLSSGADDADDAGLVVRDLRTPAPWRRRRHPRRMVSRLAAVAAVLLMAILADLLFGLRQPPPGGQPIIWLRAVQTGRLTEYTLPTLISAPSTIVAGRDGALWFTEAGAGAIGRLSPTGAFTEFRLPHADSKPNGLTLGPDGNFWFTESFGSRIGRITPAGAITEFAVPSAATSSSGLAAITTGPDGNLWFVESLSDRIGRITPKGVITEFRLPQLGNVPTDIVAGPDGNLWFTEIEGNQVGRITPQGQHITEFDLPQLGSGPDGITKGPDGNLWFTEADGNRIGQITPQGTLQGHITEFPVPTAYGLANRAAGQERITAGPDGNLWFVEVNGNAIGRITPQAGHIDEFPLPTDNSGPNSITTGPDGGLWFTENYGNRIGRFSP